MTGNQVFFGDRSSKLAGASFGNIDIWDKAGLTGLYNVLVNFGLPGVVLQAPSPPAGPWSWSLPD